MAKSVQSQSPFRYGYPWTLMGFAPVLLAQGWYVRRTVPRLAEPEGDRSGSHGIGPLLRLLIIGDSAAAGVGVAHQAQALSGQIVQALAKDFCISWRLIAQTGYTTKEILERLHQTAAEPFDVAVISIGVNDVTHRISAADWIARKQQLLQLLTARFQVRQILCSTLPPMHRFPALPAPLRWYLGSRVRHFNAELTSLLKNKSHCQLVTTDLDGSASIMARDGFHPGEPIYARWAALLVEKVQERWLPAKTALHG